MGRAFPTCSRRCDQRRDDAEVLRRRIFETNRQLLSVEQILFAALSSIAEKFTNSRAARLFPLKAIGLDQLRDRSVQSPQRTICEDYRLWSRHRTSIPASAAATISFGIRHRMIRLQCVNHHFAVFEYAMVCDVARLSAVAVSCGEDLNVQLLRLAAYESPSIQHCVMQSRINLID
ncbi:MAG: hypothetical protein R3C19_05785 [Planctomycetaceae bacterium]